MKPVEKKEISQDREINQTCSLKRFKRGLTDDEKKIIKLADEASNKRRISLGLRGVNIDDSRLVVVKSGPWWDNYFGDALFHSNSKTIYIKETSSKLVFACKVYHEIIHYKSYGLYSLKKNGRKAFQGFRCGLSLSRDGGCKNYFNGLNEAITEELAREFVLNLPKKQPLFRKEISERDWLLKNYGDTAVDNFGRPFFTPDTFFAELVNIDGAERLLGDEFTRGQERRILKLLIEKLWWRNRQQFSTPAQVFDLFARVLFTGSIKKLGKLIEDTFGCCTFEKIAFLEEDLDRLEKFVKKL